MLRDCKRLAQGHTAHQWQILGLESGSEPLKPEFCTWCPAPYWRSLLPGPLSAAHLGRDNQLKRLTSPGMASSAPPSPFPILFAAVSAAASCTLMRGLKTMGRGRIGW